MSMGYLHSNDAKVRSIFDQKVKQREIEQSRRIAKNTLWEFEYLGDDQCGPMTGLCLQL